MLGTCYSRYRSIFFLLQLFFYYLFVGADKLEWATCWAETQFDQFCVKYVFFCSLGSYTQPEFFLQTVTSLPCDTLLFHVSCILCGFVVYHQMSTFISHIWFHRGCCGEMRIYFTADTHLCH